MIPQTLMYLISVQGLQRDCSLNVLVLVSKRGENGFSAKETWLLMLVSSIASRKGSFHTAAQTVCCCVLTRYFSSSTASYKYINK